VNPKLQLRAEAPALPVNILARSDFVPMAGIGKNYPGMPLDQKSGRAARWGLASATISGIESALSAGQSVSTYSTNPEKQTSLKSMFFTTRPVVIGSKRIDFNISLAPPMLPNAQRALDLSDSFLIYESPFRKAQGHAGVSK